MDNLKALKEHMLRVAITNNLFMTENIKNYKENKIFLLSISQSVNSLP